MISQNNPETYNGDNLIQTFAPTLNDLQSQLLQLIGLPAEAFTAIT
jgi:hypothetical protein